MQLSRDSRLVKWAYHEHWPFTLNSFDDAPFINGIPYQTNLCSFFWRVVLLSWLQIVALIFFFIFVGVIIAVGWPIAWVWEKAKKAKRNYFPPKEEDFGPTIRELAREFIAAKKQKVCPIIRITE